MVKRIVSAACGVAAALVLSACGSSSPDQNPAPQGAPAPSSQMSQEKALPPAGYGTLRQDAFTVNLTAGVVQMKVTPLAESVIRLAAPDTYQRLHSLVQSRQNQIRQIARNAGLREDPGVYLVSFFTRQKQGTYEPDDVELLSNGILYRPLGIIPLTVEWGRYQVKQQVSQSALYLFDPKVDLDVTFQVEYAGVVSLQWAQIVRTLDIERGRVISRAAG